MKLTKRHLRRIIREELQLLREQSRDPRDSQTMTGFDNFGPEAEAEDERDLLMAALEKEYGLKVKTTEDWGGTPGGVWIAQEAAANPSDGLPLFDYYMEDEPYTFGVHEDFEDFLKPYGFFPEWNDPGTLMLWRA